jgi:hypothetical protein
MDKACTFTTELLKLVHINFILQNKKEWIQKNQHRTQKKIFIMTKAQKP